MKTIAALSLAALMLQARTPPATLDIALMIDVSHSVTHPGFFKTDRALVTDAGAALAGALEPGDRVLLGTFGSAIAITPAALTDGGAIAAAASRLAESAGGPSPVWDALDAAASALDGFTGQRAIIIVTDGRSTANRLGFADVLERLKQATLPVFVVAIDLKRPPGPDPLIRLRQLSDTTGGGFFFVKRSDVAGGVRRAVGALRLQRINDSVARESQCGMTFSLRLRQRRPRAVTPAAAPAPDGA